MKIRGKRISTEIPTSSQSDIAFLLIIFFLITTGFIIKTGLSMALPEASANPEKVFIDDIGIIFIGLEENKVGSDIVPDPELREAIDKFSYPYILVYVQPDVTYGKVAMVMSYLQGKNSKISVRMEE